MKIKTEEIKAKDLKPGDLFSMLGDEYWSTIDRNKYAVGQKVFIRTNIPAPENQKEDVIFRITIEK